MLRFIFGNPIACACAAHKQLSAHKQLQLLVRRSSEIPLLAVRRRLLRDVVIEWRVLRFIFRNPVACAAQTPQDVVIEQPAVETCVIK